MAEKTHDPTRRRLRDARKRGEVVWYRGVVNQDGKIVQEGELATLVEAKPIAKTDARSAAE